MTSSMQENTVKFQYTASQEAFLFSQAKFPILYGGIGSGKTHIGAIRLLLEAQKCPGGLLWAVAPDYPMSKDIERKIFEVFPSWAIVSFNRFDRTFYLWNGAEINLKSGNIADKLRGPKPNYIWIDEACFVSLETFNVLVGRVASKRGALGMTTTPKYGTFLHDKFKSGRNDGKRYHFTHCTSYDNVFDAASHSEYREMENDYDEITYRQEVLAEWVCNMEGRIFAEFDEVENLGDCPFNQSLPVWIGMDFNYNPQCGLIIQEQPNDEIWGVDEYHLKTTSTQGVASYLMTKYPNAKIICDPAGRGVHSNVGKSDVTILTEAGFDVYYRRYAIPTIDTENALRGIIRNMAGTRKLKLSRSKCPHTIKSIRQIEYKQGTQDMDKSSGLDHHVDAVKYYAEFRHGLQAKVRAL